MEMDVWHGYQSGSLHDCQKISLSFFVVTFTTFLCGYCAFTEVEKLRKEAHGDSKVQEIRLSNLFLSDANEHYGRRQNVRIFGVEEQTGEDVYQQVVDVMKGTSVEICKSEISVCHRLPARGQSRKPTIVKFVRRETNWQWWKRKVVCDISQVRLFITMMISLSWGRVSQIRSKKNRMSKLQTWSMRKKSCTKPILIKLFFIQCMNYKNRIQVWSCVYVLIN